MEGSVGCSSAAKSTGCKCAEIPSAAVALVQRGSISRTLSLAGQFEAYQVVEIFPKVSGFVRNINVDIGDRVHRGETLAVLEVPELAAQLQGTVAQVAESKDEIVRAQHEVTRAESNYSALHADDTRLQAAAKTQPGLIAQQELDDAQAKDLASAAEVDSAKSALAAAEQKAEVAQADNQRVSAIQGYTNVIAPFDGVVVWRYANTGSLLQSGTGSDVQSLPVVTLAESGLLRLRMPVPEDAVKYVHVGDKMQVRVDALGRSLTGKVIRFTRNVSLQTRTMQTEIDVENKDLSIDPGMYANTQLELAHVDNVLTIPVGAVVDQGGQQVVYLLTDQNRVRIQPVHVGLQGSLLAEIQSGLESGNRVILSGQQGFQQGEQVVPVLQSTVTVDQTRQTGGMIDLQDDASDEQGGKQ